MEGCLWIQDELGDIFNENWSKFCVFVMYYADIVAMPS